MSDKVEYQIVGRYMDGKEVTGYHLLSNMPNKSGRYNRDQVIYLIGKGLITNCTAQLYKTRVILRGVGISLEGLPVKQENGGITRTKNIGKVSNNSKVSDVMSRVMVVGKIINHDSVVGYIVKNAGGKINKINRTTAISLAKSGKIGNAEVKDINNKPTLVGLNTNFNTLPNIDISQLDNIG